MRNIRPACVFDFMVAFVTYIMRLSLNSLGFIHRFSNFLKSTDTLGMLYCHLVRLIKRYASVIWFPYRSHILQFEQTERSTEIFKADCQT